MNEALQDFLARVADSLPAGGKLLLSKYQGEEAELQRLHIRPLSLRGEAHLSFVFHYKTRDITKNFPLADGLARIGELLAHDFRAAHLFSNSEELQLEISKKGKVFLSRHQAPGLDSLPGKQQVHDLQKHYPVDIRRPYLQALGITDAQGKLKPSMAAKWKQINKFVEIFESALEEIQWPRDKVLRVMDFGCGKGYLTFALHDYLQQRGQAAEVCGIELRENLVKLCNDTAHTLACKHLHFQCGDIRQQSPGACDVMIALHACDTATDYAIHFGLAAQAAIILCAPCCHKELRPQLQSPAVLAPLLRHGVHAGQEAEMLTDSLRALLLEAEGYPSKVFEFISLEHTDKNKMILALRKKKTAAQQQSALQQVEELKKFYGIKQQSLQRLLLQPRQ